jgi:hypothetical protein
VATVVAAPEFPTQSDTSPVSLTPKMPMLSKTPPTVRASKSANGSGVGAAVAPQTELLLSPGVLDQLQDTIFTADLEGTFTSCNLAVSRYGFTPLEVVGRKIADF